MEKKQQKGQLNRADLLKALVADPKSGMHIAEQLGLSHFVKPQKQPASLSTDERPVKKQPDKGISLSKPDKPDRPGCSFWLLHNRKQLTPSEQQQFTNKNTATKVVWKNRPKKRPPHVLLASPREVLPRLFQYLKEQHTGRRIDINKVVKDISMAKYLTRFPREQKESLGQHVHFIDDRHTHLTPFWNDHIYLQHILAAFHPEYGRSHSVLLDGNTILQSWGKSSLTDWKIPPRGSAVVIFSDLGALSIQGDRQVETWIHIGQILQRHQCTAIVLLPCHPSDCDKRLQKVFHLQSWKNSRYLNKKDSSRRKKQVEQLLVSLAPVIRLEPGLLRQMRLTIKRITKDNQMDASVEAWLWQHTDIQEPNSIAATLNPETRNNRLKEFAKLPEKQRLAALDTIRLWRGDGISEQIWFEEITSLDKDSRKLIQTDIEAANHYFSNLNNYLQQSIEQVDQETQAWFKRLEKRLPAQALEHDEVGTSLQQLKFELHKNEEGYQAEFIDPSKLPPSKKEIKKVTLYQTGTRLGLARFDPSKPPSLGYRPLALVTMRHNHIQFRTKEGRLAELSLDGEEYVTLPGTRQLTAVTDCEILQFQQWRKPDFVKKAGCDRYGLFIDLEFSADILQRFRWIEPGTFLMGSPKEEKDRMERETQHQVTLSKGFWMADTTVTQELWLAVMGENPSGFRDNTNNPVERVSWKDSIEFVKKLNKIIPGIHVKLPTEAQWEYACRAGTSTPFSFGSNITPEQVNYNGNHPYADGAKGQYRDKTVPVKSLPCNHWGLYEMHGNVWEWCNDYFGDYSKDPIIDPTGAESGAVRVVRGGSWFDGGRSVRSAIRDGYVPGGRFSFIGLRLALGHSEHQQVRPSR